jgi:hypothetical protein
MKKVCLALAVSLLASLAHAETITIDPEGLAEGTDISNAYSGVTLRHFSVVRDVDAPEGARVIVDNVIVKECLTPADPSTKCGQLGTAHFGYQTTTGGIGSSFVSESNLSVHCITTDDPGPCKWTSHEFLDATFDSAVEAVTIDSTHQSDWPTAWAFDAAGNELQVSRVITWHRQCSWNSPPGYCHQTMTVTPVAGQISRVVFAGLGGFVFLDKLTYTVP